MSRTTARSRRGPSTPATGVSLPPLPARHPALLLAALAAAVSVVISVTYPIFDPDLWQHLLVGRVIWSTHAVPHTQLWTWPTYGAPDVDYAWGFEALLWPFWKVGGTWGLFAWRWLLALATFGTAWAVARRMGARGTSALVIVALAALAARGRSMPRPENVAALLLAATLWVLESRRSGRPRDFLLVPIALLWTNVHLSWYLMFVAAGAYLLDAHLRPDAHRAGPRPLWLACGLAALALFVNPFGARAVWVPFEFVLHGRAEPLFRSIGELAPVDWSVNHWSGLPLLVLGWPWLVLARLLARRVDVAELLLCPAFVLATLSGQRFMGPLAVVATPFVARDLAALQWPGRRVPRATPAWRGIAAAAGCLLIGVPEWSTSALRHGVGLDLSRQPLAATDFMAAHDVRGRGYNQFFQAGWLLWRFWPERDRLPFMDIHQAGTRRDRDLVAYASAAGGDAWRALDRERRFDWVLLPRDAGDAVTPLADALDADSTWMPVFLDDAAALYVRRQGPFAGLARQFGYTHLPGGHAALGAVGGAAATDTVARRAIEGELRRAIAASPRHAEFLGLLANLALLDARWDDAIALLHQALAIQPLLPRAHERIGIAELQRGHPREARAEFETEWRRMGWGHGLDFRRGQVLQAEGNLHAARDAYAREVRRSPTMTEARDSLAAVEARLGR